ATYYLGSSVGGAAGAWVYGHEGWPWLIAVVVAWLLLAVAAVGAGTRVRAVRRELVAS
ncbi:MFS transporter, partial [Amycolatopsis sp. SID8362]|nr:MFS transporter [Amycolatopsis sp. SID8362]NED47528.1 MFS transporter [Amycolatopsis sp. SID8362]